MARTIHATTVLCVRRSGEVAIGADGQVTLGDAIVKNDAMKLRKLAGGKVLLGFAGSSADALILADRFDGKLTAQSGNLRKAAVEMVKEWRTDEELRRLEAMLIVADFGSTFILTQDGDVIEPTDGVAALGTGGPYAASAARALLVHTKLSAKEVVSESMKIAGETCIYANMNIRVDTL